MGKKGQSKYIYVASSFGLLTGTSGFFYTRDYGNAVLILFTKAIGIVGMVHNKNKGGVTNNKFLIFSSVFMGATCLDAVGSGIVAHKRNEKLNKILAISKDISFEFNNTSIETTYSILF